MTADNPEDLEAGLRRRASSRRDCIRCGVRFTPVASHYLKCEDCYLAELDAERDAWGPDEPDIW